MLSKLKFWKREGREREEALFGLRQVLEDDTGVELQYLTGLVRIEAHAPSILRFRITRNDRFPEKISNAVLTSPSDRFKLTRQPDQLRFATSELLALIPEGPFRFEIYDQDGALLSRDFPGLGPVFSGNAFRIDRHLALEEKLYGLGDEYGPLSRQGRRWSLWNRDCYRKYEHDPRYSSIPLLISARPGNFCAWFLDNPGRVQIDAGKKYPGLLSFYGVGAEADLYFLSAPSLKELVSLYTSLTGRSLLPPLWAVGYHQSRWSYFSEQEVLELVRDFESRQIPLAAVYLDIHYLDNYKLFTVNRRRFPDLAGLARKLAAKGIKLVVIIDSGVKVEPGYQSYEQGASQKFFCEHEKGGEFHARVWPGKCAFPDFFRKEVQEYWAEQHQELFQQGIAGIWNDMNEPSMWKEEIRFRDYLVPLRHLSRPQMTHLIGGRRFRHEQCRNLYGQKQCEATLLAFKKFRPGKRPFILSRSGFAGIQRLAATWTADNTSKFEHLQGSITEILSLGMCGVSFTGADIGGFRKNCSPELYARWIELGAFYPFCRTHSSLTASRQEPFRFGAEVEAIARKYISLRYRLLPTIYSLFRQSHETGLPLWRPLMMEFPDDRVASEIEDQLMFGEFLMLAPVLKAGARTRSIYLPAGKWTDFWSEKIFEGPGWIEMDAGLDKMPMLVREQAVLVFQPRPELKIPWPELELDLYPGLGSSRFPLYEDDGESEGYLGGEFSLREFKLEKTESGCRFSISGRQGNLAVQPRQVKIKLHLQKSSPSILVDSKQRTEFSFNSELSIAEFNLLLDDNPHQIEFTK